jgi:hypothetical protein
VLPILDYCSAIWSPYAAVDILCIESVQRVFTKRLYGFLGLSYKERLIKSGLCTLELRRLKTDLILCYKILHGFVEINKDVLFALDPNNITRGHSWKLKMSNSRIDTRLHFYCNRVVRPWNSLSSDCVCSTSVNAFTISLELEDLSNFLTVQF